VRLRQQTVNTKAIQAAIDKCASTKRAALSLFPRDIPQRAIFLKQGVDLLVEKDGVLKGTTNMDDYPAIQSRWEGTEEMYTASLVNADGVNASPSPARALSTDRAMSSCKQSNAPSGTPAAEPLRRLQQSRLRGDPPPLVPPVAAPVLAGLLPLRRPPRAVAVPASSHPELQGSGRLRAASAQPGHLVPLRSL